MKHRWSLVLIAACSGGSTDDDDPIPMVTPPKATALEVSECKGSCNQLKFFDCDDSVEQAGCYLNCENATSSQIELFNGCVQTDICDPTCSTHIKPANPPSVMSDPDDCSSACARLGADGCIPPESVAGCQGLCSSGTTSDRGTILYCESRRSGCMLPEECAPPMMDPVAECKDACDTLGFFSCINAQSQANCRNLCGTVADDV